MGCHQKERRDREGGLQAGEQHLEGVEERCGETDGHAKRAAVVVKHVSMRLQQVNGWYGMESPAKMELFASVPSLGHTFV